MIQGNYLSLLEEKLSVLKRVYENIQVDESNVEECLGAIETNEGYFAQLKEIESRLEQLSSEVTAETTIVLEEIYSILLRIKEGTLRLAKTIHMEREISVKALGQFSKKREFANSYMKMEQRSVFVDKDFR